MTHTGKVRDHNEDNFILNPILSRDDWFFDTEESYMASDLGAIWVVADGMGGTNAGEVASEIAVQTIKDIFRDKNTLMENKGHPENFLKKSILEVNERILKHSKQNPETDNMGTTIVVSWLIDNVLHTSWIGDSRAYLFRNSQLSMISKDHSLVQQMIDAGKLTDEQAFYHPQNNIITQSLGDETKKLAPGYKAIQLYKADYVLLCTDGLNGMLLDASIESILQKAESFSNAAKQLLEESLNEGAHDNVTLILAQVTEGSQLPKNQALSDENMKEQYWQPEPVKEEKLPKKESPKSRKLRYLLIILLVLFAFVLGFLAGKYTPEIKNIKSMFFEASENKPDEYHQKMKQASDNMQKKDFKSAYKFYNEALKLYIKDTTEAAEGKRAAADSLKNRYDSMLKKGDAFLKQKEFQKARDAYIESANWHLEGERPEEKLENVKREEKTFIETHGTNDESDYDQNGNPNTNKAEITEIGADSLQAKTDTTDNIGLNREQIITNTKQQDSVKKRDTLRKQ